MKYILTFSFFILFITTSLSQKKLIITVVSIDGKQLDDVSIYADNNLVGITTVQGNFELVKNDYQKFVFIKAGFEEKVVLRDDIVDDVILYEIGIRNLDAIEIIKRDAIVEFDKLLAGTRNGKLYRNKSDNAIFNSFTSGRDTLHYLNNKVYWVPNKGLHIENKKNVVQNFKSHSFGEIISNIYEINDVKMELSYKFANRPLTMSYLEPFVALTKDLKEYNFYFSKKGDTIKVNFEPIVTGKNMTYTGQITYSEKDYGIFEMEFKSNGGRFYSSFINMSKKTKINFRDFDEYVFISATRREDGYYYGNGAEYLVKTEILNTKAKGRFLTQDYRVSPIENVQPTSEIKFDLYTYEFNHR